MVAGSRTRERRTNRHHVAQSGELSGDHFGAFLAGGVIVNVNPLYKPHELEHQLNDAGVASSSCWKTSRIRWRKMARMTLEQGRSFLRPAIFWD